jgi:large conductance mechanosensitive channel
LGRRDIPASQGGLKADYSWLQGSAGFSSRIKRSLFMLKEFKAFVNQGNALDLAVGVMIGAAFGKIVNSIVADIITPVISLALGRIDFKNMYIPLAGQGNSLALDKAREAGAVIAYGNFINNVVEFLVVAFTIFMVVRQINKWRGPAPKA